MPQADPPIRVDCVAGCGWIGKRREAVAEARPCPWCDAAVLPWREPPLVFRAARAVEAVKARMLCPPEPDRDEVEPFEPIRGFTHRIWIVSEGRYETHTIPPHCRKGARRKRRR